jgi:hypothetical protein
MIAESADFIDCTERTDWIDHKLMYVVSAVSVFLSGSVVLFSSMFHL